MKHLKHASQATRQVRSNTEERDGGGENTGEVVGHREREREQERERGQKCETFRRNISTCPYLLTAGIGEKSHGSISKAI